MHNFSIVLLVLLPIMAISMILLISQNTLLLYPQFILNVHYTTIWTAFLILLLASFIAYNFDFGVALFQFVETKFTFFGMHYKLGIDGISLFFIVLFAVLFLVAMLVIRQDDVIEMYHACVLLLMMQAACMVLLISLNLLAILCFLGVSLFCLYIVLSSKDVDISSNDLWYMFSLLVAADMLVWLVIGYIYNQTGLLNLDELILYEFSEQEKLTLFSMLFIASLMHVGMFPWYKSWIYLCRKKTAIILCLMMVNAMIYLICRMVISLFPVATSSIVSYIAIPLLCISAINNVLVPYNFLQKIVFNHVPLIILSIFLGKDGIIGSIFYLIGYNIIHLAFIIFAYTSQFPIQHTFQVAQQTILGLPTSFIIDSIGNKNIDIILPGNNHSTSLEKLTNLSTYQKDILIVLISIALGFIPNVYLIGYLIILQSLFEVSGLMFILGITISLSIFVHNVLLYQHLLFCRLSKLELFLVVFLILLAIVLGLFPNIIANSLSHSFFLKLD